MFQRSVLQKSMYQWDIHSLASQLDALDNLQAEQWSTSVGWNIWDHLGEIINIEGYHKIERGQYFWQCTGPKYVPTTTSQAIITQRYHYTELCVCVCVCVHLACLCNGRSTEVIWPWVKHWLISWMNGLEATGKPLVKAGLRWRSRLIYGGR